MGVSGKELRMVPGGPQPVADFEHFANKPSVVGREIGAFATAHESYWNSRPTCPRCYGLRAA